MKVDESTSDSCEGFGTLLSVSEHSENLLKDKILPLHLQKIIKIKRF